LKRVPMGFNGQIAAHQRQRFLHLF
jgi:hypothetical protein